MPASHVDAMLSPCALALDGQRVRSSRSFRSSSTSCSTAMRNGRTASSILVAECRMVPMMPPGDKKARDVPAPRVSRTRAMARSKAQAFVSVSNTRSTIAAVQPMLDKGIGPDSKPLRAITRAYLALGVAQLDEYGGELAGAQLAPPS